MKRLGGDALKAIGIDIGSHSIKIAEVHGSGSQTSIVNLQVYPRSQKPGVDKELEVITMLKEITSLYNKNEFSFVLALPQEDVSTRNLFFPFKDKYKILKSLPFELEDLTPISAHEGIFECKIIKTMPHGSDVLAIASPKENVKRVLDLCSDINIDPDFIGVEGFALNNLFEDIFAAPPHDPTLVEEDLHYDEGGEREKREHIGEQKDLQDGEAILDIGHISSTLIVRSQSSVYAIRQINWGGKNLNEALAKKLNIQSSEAAQRIQALNKISLNKKQGSTEEQKISAIISEEIAKLGSILKLSLLEVRGLHAIDIKGIGLIGGLASLKNLGPKLTESTLVACNKILKIKNYPELDLNSNSNNELSMGTAIGLALEAFKRPTNPPINLRRDDFKKDNTLFTNFWADWGFYINLTAASLFVFFIYAFLRSSISEELAYQARSDMRSAGEAVLNIKGYNVTESKLKGLFSKVDKREKAKKKILEKTSEKDFILSSLKRISEKAGSRLSFPTDIQKLKIDGDTILIQGTSSNSSEVKSFARKLKSLAKGDINQSFHPQDGKTSFSISFKPKDNL